MDALSGTVLALAAAWASVLAAIALPLDRWLDARGLRWAGAASLATVAARVLGAPVPAEAPLAVLGAGLALAAWRVRARRACASTRAGGARVAGAVAPQKRE